MSTPRVASTSIKDGHVYTLRIPEGGVVSQVDGSMQDEVHIRKNEGQDSQKWEAVLRDGNVSFFNLHNQRLLGSDAGGHLQAAARDLGDSARFSIDMDGDEFRLLMEKDDDWYGIVRPHGQDTLELCVDDFTPIILEEA